MLRPLRNAVSSEVRNSLFSLSYLIIFHFLLLTAVFMLKKAFCQGTSLPLRPVNHPLPPESHPPGGVNRPLEEGIVHFAE